MVRKLITLFIASLLVCSLSTLTIAQDAPAKDKMAKDNMAKEGRVEGKILRSDKDKSMFTVHTSSGFDKTVVYDDSTKWVSQEHNSKVVNTIDVSQVKDGDRVICRGSFDDKGVLHAKNISKRLTGAM
jgi:pentapeptide MXKDX repeat protein